MLQYNALGNQTLVKTLTRDWPAAYNAANRAVSFTSQDGNIVVECEYDDQGRRYMKKVTENGTITSHERYVYRGYLQIAALDMLNSRNVLRTLLWDPLEPIATRPLALVQDNALYCFGVDFSKNVTEVFDGQATFAATYDYSPYGQVSSAGPLVQSVQWFSEMNDEELALVYYNYRYYNPTTGRWVNMDPLGENGGLNLFAFVSNNAISNTDFIGLVNIIDVLISAKCERCYNEIYYHHLTTAEERHAWDFFTHHSGGRNIIIPKNEVKKIAEASDVFTKEREKAKQRCKQNKKEFSEHPKMGSYQAPAPWVLALGFVTPEATFSCKCTETTTETVVKFTTKVNIHDPYDFNPEWFSTHRTIMNELKTIGVAMLQSICGWSDFNHDGTWEETEEL